jgi:hypothetical protein
MCGRVTYERKLGVLACAVVILFIQIIQAPVIQITLVKHLAMEAVVFLFVKERRISPAEAVVRSQGTAIPQRHDGCFTALDADGIGRRTQRRVIRAERLSPEWAPKQEQVRTLDVVWSAGESQKTHTSKVGLCGAPPQDCLSIGRVARWGIRRD